MNTSGTESTVSTSGDSGQCRTHGQVAVVPGIPVHFLKKSGSKQQLPPPVIITPDRPPLLKFLDSLYDAAILIDQAGVIIETNPRSTEMLEYSPVTFKGMNISEIVDQLDANLLRIITDKIAEQQHVLIEACCRGESGAEIPAEIAFSRARQFPTATLCLLIRDITEHKKLENRLQIAEQAWQCIVHGIAMTDARGMIQSANPAFISLLNYTAEQEVIGLNIRHFLANPAELDGVIRRLQQYFICSRRIKGQRKNSTTVPLQVTAAPVPGSEGQLSSMIFSIEDISPALEAEKLRQRNELHRHDIEMHQACLNTIAELGYELNNPLQALLGMAEEDKRQDYQEQINRIIEIVRQLYTRQEIVLQERAIANKTAPDDTAAPESTTSTLKSCTPDTVLITDDEPMIRRLFERMLNEVFPDLRIEHAENGRQALELFAETHHAVIIMDVMMPEMTGEAAFAELDKFCRENQWEPPHCIFCTGFMPSDRLSEIIRDTQHALLRKPVSRNEILAVIKNFMKKK